MLASMSATALYAKDNKTTTDTKTETKDDAGKTKVEAAALPEAVKATLATDAYKEYKVSEAWMTKGTPDVYTLQLANGEKTMTVNIDKDGKVKKD